MILFEERTHSIINACMNVHNELGNGFLEPVYQSALALEFGFQDIPYSREHKIDVFYRGLKLDHRYIADFICYDSIIVELKAASCLVKAHKAQVINYLAAMDYKIGLLINFGQNSLKWERISYLHDNKEKEDRKS
ncbi:MAG: GxxExxY protein [Spirochaetaceae bacterium]|nr:GxxExxY protein [Spirochaetaceae bacterium]